MKERVYDPVRKRYIAATPEELVRQMLLRKMIHELGYPKGLIAVEKDLGESKRRADVICYGCHIHPDHELSPLLVIECKAWDCSTNEAREQAFGYNATLGAPFVCVANKMQTITLWFDGCKLESVPFLPPYRELYQIAQKIIRFPKQKF